MIPPLGVPEISLTLGGIGSNSRFNRTDLVVAAFEVEARRLENAAVLVARGELDLATVGILEAALEQASLDDHSRVVVDLSAVNFMDSTGMRALIVANQRLEATHGSFGVVIAGGPVARALAVAGIDRLLKFFDTLEAATA